MIVECASCNTKFSVDAQQLAGIEDPRFHCCRCGSYFKIETEPERSADGFQTPADVAASEHTAAKSESARDGLNASAARRATEQKTTRPEQKSPPIAASAGVSLVSSPVSSPVSSLGESENGADWTPDLDKMVDEYLSSERESKSAEQLTWQWDQPRPSLQQRKTDADDNTVPNHSRSAGAFFIEKDAADDESDANSWPKADWVAPGTDEFSTADLTRSKRGHSDSRAENAPESDSAPSRSPRNISRDSGFRRIGVKPLNKMNALFTRAKVQFTQAEDGEAETDVVASSSSATPETAPHKSAESEPAEEQRLGAETERQLRRAEKRSRRYEKLLEPLKSAAAASGTEEVEPGPKERFASLFSKKPGPQHSLFEKIPSLAVICSVPVLAIAALGFASLNLESSPRILEPLLKANASYFPRIPPTGLDLGAMKSRFLVLEGGETALEISGIILNGSQATVSDLVIEAAVYNRDNEPITELRVNPNNLLGTRTSGAPADKTSDISTLKAEDLLALQQEVRDKPFLITPNTSTPFRIVVPAGQADLAEGAKWFSAKVRSVLI